MREIELFRATDLGWVSMRTGELLESDDGGSGGFILGETKPSALNTGITVPTTSTQSGGNLFIDVGGTVANPLVYENVRFSRRVVPRAANIVFSDCFFDGPPTVTHNALFDATHLSCSNIQLLNCDFAPQATAQAWDRAIIGHDIYAYRCHIRGTLDGVTIATNGPAANINFEGCYVHGLWFQSPTQGSDVDSTPDNFTHNDCFQFGGTVGAYNNARFFGCTIHDTIDPLIGFDYKAPTYSGAPLPDHSNITDGYPWYEQGPFDGAWGSSGASFMFSPAGAATTLQNITIAKNWIDYGPVGLNMAGFTGTQTGLKVDGNRWGRDFRAGEEWTIIKASGLHFGSLTGNTYEDDGTPWNRGGGSGTWP